MLIKDFWVMSVFWLLPNKPKCERSRTVFRKLNHLRWAICEIEKFSDIHSMIAMIQ